MNKSPYIVIQSSQAPYSSSHAIDALEAAIAATNIGLEVIFIFIDEGVYQLLNNQENMAITHKSMFKQLLALPLYDVERIYAQSSALNAYNIPIPTNMPDLRPIDDANIVDLCKHAQHVLVF